jgi:hypothetical protein
METTIVTVWILEAGYYYEDSNILGVFASEQLATDYKENNKENLLSYDYISITPHTVVSR